jgi:hypothetical protein
VDVDFAITNITQPIGVSEYKFSKLLRQSLKSKMPTASQLKQEMKNFIQDKKKSEPKKIVYGKRIT